MKNMSIKHFFVILIGSIFIPFNVCAQNSCSYCKGTGLIKRRIVVASYGINTDKWYCDVCKNTFIDRHTHVSCPHCVGGEKRVDKSSDDIKYSSEDYSAMNDFEYVLTPEEEALCRQIATDIMYGLPMTDEELKLVIDYYKTNPQYAAQYVKWRNILNSGTIYYNKSHQMLQWTSVKSIDNFHSLTCNQLAELVKTFSVPENLASISNQLHAKFVRSYQEYRSYSDAMESLTNIQNQLDNYRLNQLMLGF